MSTAAILVMNVIVKITNPFFAIVYVFILSIELYCKNRTGIAEHIRVRL